MGTPKNLVLFPVFLNFDNTYFLDLPGPPREIKVSDITRGSCRLTWKPPVNDGGMRIMSYFIEKKTVEGKAWTKVNPACASQSFVVPDLIAGQDYLFRIRAENNLGLGPHIDTIQRTTARDPIREIYNCIYTIWKKEFENILKWFVLYT